jgi:cytochrome c551
VISDILALEGDATSGEALFAGTCSGCHGADGDSGTAPMLSERIPAASDEEIVGVMIEGSGNMPPVSVEDQEAADILAFLRASF